ncbi:MAG TPA: homoserine kinase [Candidatus Acidoferrum sp.]|nr:homoserine kinase [Candidatus Acidoferrum sp.]
MQGITPAQTDWVSASAPASSANLGCAFDCAALALNLRVRASARLRAEDGFAVEYRGPHAERVPCDESNLVAQGILRYARQHGIEIAGAEIEVGSEIPVGVGLGSSAAATVCGLFLGAALIGAEPDHDEILRLAAGIEGHPDNATAAVHGGLTFAAVEQSIGRILFARTGLPAGVKILVVAPTTPTLTKESRATLPREYSRADAVHNLQRASLLAAFCFSGASVDNIEPELFHDTWHQPFRAPAVPGLAECLKVRHPDLLGVCMSGSGSAAIAFVRESEERIAELLSAAFVEHGGAPAVLFLQQEQEGARIETGQTYPAARAAAAGMTNCGVEER